MLGIGEKHELPTVLLIDDDLVSREVIATVLTLHGHMVHTAENGNSSLEMLDAGSFTPQVILMDAQLPGLSGVSLIEQLRSRSTADIYVISGSDASPEITAAANGFLRKPFGPEDLRRLIDEHAPKPEEVANPDEPVVNPEILAQFRQLMSEPAIREIYVAVVTDLKKRHTALETAIAAGNSDEVRRIGHAIKGGCGMAGAVQAARLGAFFESKSDQLDNCAVAAQELYTATRKLERMLEKEFPA
jgi:CheY-like chemotaxis protein/HPt (histidine-containing phosphotransfer) domain-containing protein